MESLTKLSGRMYYIFLATGEMGICMSICAVFALRHALDSARNDAGIDAWYELGE